MHVKEILIDQATLCVFSCAAKPPLCKTGSGTERTRSVANWLDDWRAKHVLLKPLIQPGRKVALWLSGTVLPSIAGMA